MKKSISFIVQVLFWVIHGIIYFFPLSVLGSTGQFPASLFDTFLALTFVLLTLAIPFYGSLFISKQILIKKNRVRILWIGIFVAFVTLYTSLFPKTIIDFYNGSLSSIGDDYESLNNYINLFISVSIVFIYSALGFIFSFLSEWNKNKTLQELLENKNIKTELELLKSQISPHFLFNTLNNIDILILDEPKRASDYLKKLSEILRFLLYETNAKKVPLANEVAYINKYIELQKIRTTNDKFVKLEIIGNDRDGFIAPMIFIHFVENAFKFATNKKIENAISIRLNISDNKVSFICKNHINSSEATTQVNNGLGLKLIKQRLDLIYKDDYSLDIREEENWYIVNLEIQLGND